MLFPAPSESQNGPISHDANCFWWWWCWPQVKVTVGDTKSQYTSANVTLTLKPGPPKHLELASDTLGIKEFQEDPEAPMHNSMEVRKANFHCSLPGNGRRDRLIACTLSWSFLKIAVLRVRILDEARSPISYLMSNAKLVATSYLEKSGSREPPPGFKEGK